MGVSISIYCDPAHSTGENRRHWIYVNGDWSSFSYGARLKEGSTKVNFPAPGVVTRSAFSYLRKLKKAGVPQTKSGAFLVPQNARYDLRREPCVGENFKKAMRKFNEEKMEEMLRASPPLVEQVLREMGYGLPQ